MIKISIRRFLKDIVTYGLSAIGEKSISFFLFPIYTRVFTVKEYGVIDLTTMFTTILLIFLELGLKSAVGRFYVDAEENNRQLSATTALFYLLGISLISLGIFIPFSPWISRLIFGTIDYQMVVVVMSLAIPANLLFAFFQNMLKWRLQVFSYSAISIGTLLCRTSLTIYLIVVLKQGIIGIYWAAFSTYLISSIIGFWLTRSSYTFAFSIQQLGKLLRYGIPLVPLSLSHFIMTFSDRYFLRIYVGLESIGLYAASYKITSVMNLLLAGFRRAWGPFIYASYRRADAKELFADIYNFVSLFMLFFLLSLSLFSREILTILATSRYLSAYRVVPLLTSSIILYTVGGYFSFGLDIVKETKPRAWASLTAALINIVLNIILIPYLGIVGAALATFISFFGLAILLIKASQKRYRINYNFHIHAIYYGVAGILILIGYRFFIIETTVQTILLRLLLIILALCLPVLFGVVGKSKQWRLKALIRDIFSNL